MKAVHIHASRHDDDHVACVIGLVHGGPFLLTGIVAIG
jgi:hypothetical protein